MIVNLMITGCWSELYCSWKGRQAVGLNSTVVGKGGFMIVNLMITGCWSELYCSWKGRFHDCQSYDYRLWV